jgi:hypothetical protein
MYHFHEEYEKRAGNDLLPPLIPDLEILADGETANPAAWSDWMASVRAIKGETMPEQS